MTFVFLVFFNGSNVQSKQTITGHLYNISVNTDVVGLLLIETILTDNVPTNCLMKCNKMNNCVFLTVTKNICTFYDYISIGGVTSGYFKTTSLITTLYQKYLGRSFNQKCTNSFKCNQNVGLFCSNNICLCSKNLYFI